MDSCPAEILDCICEQLPPRELTALATCTSRLCHASRRILYRDVNVGTTTVHLTSILASNPKLAEYVVNFRIAIRASTSLPNNFDNTLSSALSSMHKLQSLSISLPPQSNHSSALPRAPFTTYSQLRDFRASFGLDANVVHFLQKAPNLVFLKLFGSGSVDAACSEIPLGCLRHLEVFSGGTSAAQIIVPGRPVHSILLSADELTAQTVPTLSLSSVPVTALDLSTNSPVEILRALADTMPFLEHVRVQTQCVVRQGYCDKDIVNAIEKIINTMECLIEVNVLGMNWRWTEKRPRCLVRGPKSLALSTYFNSDPGTDDLFPY